MKELKESTMLSLSSNLLVVLSSNMDAALHPNLIINVWLLSHPGHVQGKAIMWRFN